MAPGDEILVWSSTHLGGVDFIGTGTIVTERGEARRKLISNSDGDLGPH